MKTTSLINTDVFINIVGIDEPIICEYFTKLNNGEFIDTAALFADQGCLKPPFEKMLQGRNAIAQYLDQEAKGIRLCPEYGNVLLSNSLLTEYQIQGKVKTNYFTVNVNWLFHISNHKEILLVEIKLLASLDELLNFKKG